VAQRRKLTGFHESTLQVTEERNRPDHRAVLRRITKRFSVGLGPESAPDPGDQPVSGDPSREPEYPKSGLKA